jgi:hypothetical protein
MRWVDAYIWGDRVRRCWEELERYVRFCVIGVHRIHRMRVQVIIIGKIILITVLIWN